jgi:hypothetical protein
MRRLRRFWRLAVRLLRELADESAYRRSLEASGRPHSPEAWRRFTEERYGNPCKRPKCC